MGGFPWLVAACSGGGERGLAVFRIQADGVLAPAGGAGEGVEQPLFVAMGPGGDRLYVADPLRECDGEPGGALAAFAFDRATGGLRFLNRQPVGGRTPCYVDVAPSGRHVVTANYSDGSISVLPIDPHGRLGERVQRFDNVGSSVNASRQEGPHAHSSRFDPTGRFLLACDLGTDEILAFAYDADAQAPLRPLTDTPRTTHPGAGPRHPAFHPSQRHVYVLNELDSTLMRFDWDPATGDLAARQTVTTLPADFEGVNHPSDLHVHPSGRFVYAANRGHDSLAIFEASPGTGDLNPVGWQATLGANPRGFAIHPRGDLLVAGNQDTGSIVPFHINLDTGELTPTGQAIEAAAPVCFVFAPGLE